MKNFTKKYIANPNRFPGTDDTIKIYEHENGVKVQIDSYVFEDNSVMFIFESGLMCSVKLVGSDLKITTTDEVYEVDLAGHACFKTQKSLLIKLHIRRAVRNAEASEILAMMDAIEEILF